MNVRAAVVDQVPLFRRGVIAVLHEAGQAVDEPTDIHAWLDESTRNVVLIGLRTPTDWSTLVTLHTAQPNAHLLALIDDPSPTAYLRALDAGVAGVVPRAGSPEQLRNAFAAVIRSEYLLPASVVSALLGRTASPAQASPSPQEQEWLRLLATGCTVAELSSVAGYSERMMFRLLRSLYDRMAVRSRVEALMRAREEGWI